MIRDPNFFVNSKFLRGWHILLKTAAIRLAHLLSLLSKKSLLGAKDRAMHMRVAAAMQGTFLHVMRIS